MKEDNQNYQEKEKSKNNKNISEVDEIIINDKNRNITIEREIDPLDELNQPSIIKTSTESSSKSKDKKSNETNNKSKKVKNNTNELEVTLKGSEKHLNNSKKDSITEDNVKVDEEGIPQLNQLSTLNLSNRFKKIIINKRTLIRVLTLLVGFILILYGILQSFKEIVHIADNVSFGEHISISVALIFVGIVLIVSLFAESIINKLGVIEITNSTHKNKRDKK
ncbi:MAG: hypothetical protein Q4Q23_04985 [Methanobacteriaceae archaeon]|nr:hypothetical protein [Methanobacteriaceae archaeon]